MTRFSQGFGLVGGPFCDVNSGKVYRQHYVHLLEIRKWAVCCFQMGHQYSLPKFPYLAENLEKFLHVSLTLYVAKVQSLVTEGDGYNKF